MCLQEGGKEGCMALRRKEGCACMALTGVVPLQFWSQHFEWLHSMNEILVIRWWQTLEWQISRFSCSASQAFGVSMRGPWVALESVPALHSRRPSGLVSIQAILSLVTPIVKLIALLHSPMCVCFVQALWWL